MILTGSLPTRTPNASPRCAAGSVVTIKVLNPLWAAFTAMTQDIVVLPTPPLPMKKTAFVPFPATGRNKRSRSGCSTKMSEPQSDSAPSVNTGLLPLNSSSATDLSLVTPFTSPSRRSIYRFGFWIAASVSLIICFCASYFFLKNSSSQAASGRMPFMMIWPDLIPMVSSSFDARSVSYSESASGRITKMKVVRLGSLRSAVALSYFSLESWIVWTGPRQVWPLPFADVSICLDQSTGSSSSRIVCPVGAVSKTMISYSSPSMKSINRSKDAISVVQGPLKFSSREAITSGGITSRNGPMMRSLYSIVATSGSISMAQRF